MLNHRVGDVDLGKMCELVTELLHAQAKLRKLARNRGRIEYTEALEYARRLERKVVAQLRQIGFDPPDLS